MESEKHYLDIDELAKRIEERIKALDNKTAVQKEQKETNDELVVDRKTNDKLSDLDRIINEIDKRINELDKETVDELDVNELMDKINTKLINEEEKYSENELYDLDEITKAINETIKSLQEKRKRQRDQKARYCDLARRNYH